MGAGLHQGVGLGVVQLMTHAHAQAVAEGPPCGALPAVAPQARRVRQVAQLLEAHPQALPKGGVGLLGLCLLLGLQTPSRLLIFVSRERRT